MISASAEMPLTTCRHCGAELRTSNSVQSNEFCCSGCEFVYGSVQQLGLSHFYDLQKKDWRGSVRPATGAEKQTFLSFDEIPLQKSRNTSSSESDRCVTLYLEGVHCNACVWLLEQLPRLRKGIQSARLNFEAATIRIDFNPAQIRLSQIAELLNSLGYTPHFLDRANAQAARTVEDRQLVLRIGVAAVSAMNCMMMAVSLYQGEASGMESSYAWFFRVVSMVVAAPAVVFSAWPFYAAAWFGLKLGRCHIDLPLSVAIIGAFLVSSWSALTGDTDIFFDSITSLIFLLLLGRLLQRRALRRAQRDTQRAHALFPAQATRLEGETRAKIAIESIKPGDLIEVCSGERFACDGVIQAGQSSVEESVLNGESKPRLVEIDSKVQAGTLNLESTVVVRAVAVGENSRLGQVLKLLDDAALKKAPIVEFADKVSGYFVLVVIAAALSGFFIWLPHGLPKALSVATALLIVTCPCALGIATPIVFSVALGRAAKLGILIKGSRSIEALAQSKQFFFDKTGTLTESCMSVVASWYEDASAVGGSRATELVMLLEENCKHHPLAQALLAFCGKEAMRADSKFSNLRDRVKSRPGLGPQVEIEGVLYRLGAYREVQNEPNQELQNLAARWLSEGHSVIALYQSERAIALFALSNLLRHESKQTIDFLRDHGKKISILSGDSKSVVEKVAAQLSISSQDAHAELLPEKKLEFIEQVKSGSVMVGDGVNDAVAMKAAEVSMGMRGGAEVCLEVCDIYLSDGKIESLKTALRGAERTMRVVYRNFGFSLCYNTVGALLAFSGHLPPLMAAILMPISSFTVILNAVLTPTFKDEALKGNS